MDKMYKVKLNTKTAIQNMKIIANSSNLRSTCMNKVIQEAEEEYPSGFCLYFSPSSASLLYSSIDLSPYSLIFEVSFFEFIKIICDILNISLPDSTLLFYTKKMKKNKKGGAVIP